MGRHYWLDLGAYVGLLVRRRHILWRLLRWSSIGSGRLSGEGSSKIIQGNKCGVYGIPCWLAIMLALYYMRHRGSFQMSFFGNDMDRCHSAPIHDRRWVSSL